VRSRKIGFEHWNEPRRRKSTSPSIDCFKQSITRVTREIFGREAARLNTHQEEENTGRGCLGNKGGRPDAKRQVRVVRSWEEENGHIEHPAVILLNSGQDEL
jgi:hypothetical protein